MTIGYTCSHCETEGTIDLHRQFESGTPFHRRALESLERAELDEKQASHQKDMNSRHTLQGKFTLPSGIRKLPDGWLMR